MYIEEELSAVQTAKELELVDKSRVYKWVAIFNEKRETAFDEETRGKMRGPGKGRPRTRFDSPEEKMKYLEIENEVLKKRLAARWKGEQPKFLK